MDGGGHQHALALRAGALEDDPAHPVVLGFVQQVVFAPAGQGLPVIGLQHLVHPVGVHAGGVQHEAGGHIAGGRVQHKARAGVFNAGDRAVPPQLHAAAHRGLGHGDGKAPGVDDAGAGREKRAAHFLRKPRLHRPGLLAGEQPQPGHAVFAAPVVKGAQGGQLLGAEGHHKRAHPLEGHLQLFADLAGEAVALHVQPGHQGAGLRVVARVDDGAVGLGGAGGDVRRGLQHCHPQPVAGQLIGRRRAHHAAADDDYIVHRKIPPKPNMPTAER